MRDLSALDLLFLVNELKLLLGGFIQKIYQSEKILRLEIFISGKGAFELYFSPGKIFITEYKRKAPEAPESFCAFLRKYLTGQVIKDVRQRNFDRIIEVETEQNILIFELFSKGNIILCDKNYKILMPLEVQLWRERELVPKKPYKYPPAVCNPFKLNKFELKNLMQTEKELVKALASDFSFSSVYAEEICARTKIDKTKPCKSLNDIELSALYESISSLVKEFSPQLVFDNDKIIDAVPFNMATYAGKTVQKFNTFSHALDELFTESELKLAKAEQGKAFDSELKKLERIKEEQEADIEKWNKIEKEMRLKAESIFSNFGLVQNIISRLQQARKENVDWVQIKEKISKEATPEAWVKEIREKEGIVIIEIPPKIEINFTKSVQQTANELFEDAKKAKRKLIATKRALTRTKNALEQLKAPELKEIKLKKRKRRGKWYEAYRWFFTTDGFLVIAGRDARQNEILFKKRMEPADIVLHADVHGAPLTIIKSQGKEISPIAVREAAEFAGGYSSAWKAGQACDVYWIKPEQVSKTPPPGQFLPKGAFMIRGKKNYLRKIPLSIAIGLRFEIDKSGQMAVELICGNVQSVNKHAKYFITLTPGDIQAGELAKQIKLKLLQKAMPEDKELIEQIDLDEIIRAIPSGKGEIIG